MIKVLTFNSVYAVESLPNITIFFWGGEREMLLRTTRVNLCLRRTVVPLSVGLPVDHSPH